MPGLVPGIQGRRRDMRSYYVYILASRRNGTLYIGVTSDLARRAFQHKTGNGSSFTQRYGVMNLVHAEAFDDVRFAIQREKTLKHWSRAWKLKLIERDNPQWRDLFEDLPL